MTMMIMLSSSSTDRPSKCPSVSCKSLSVSHRSVNCTPCLVGAQQGKQLVLSQCPSTVVSGVDEWLVQGCEFGGLVEALYDDVGERRAGIETPVYM